MSQEQPQPETSRPHHTGYSLKPVRDWADVEASAPGKFILSGDYAVNYGRSAIAMSINLRTTVKISPRQDDKVKLILRQYNYTSEWKTSIFGMCKVVTRPNSILEYRPTFIDRLNALAKPNATETTQEDFANQTEKEDYEKSVEDATNAFLLLYLGVSDSYYKSVRPNLEVEVDSTIPIKSGMGSSSAYAVAMAGAMIRAFSVRVSKSMMGEWGLSIDKFFHYKNSGIDTMITTKGGYIMFQCNGIKMKEKPPKKTSLRALLIDCCIPRRAKDMFEKITNHFVEHEISTSETMDEINKLNYDLWDKITAKQLDILSINPEMKAFQDRLESLSLGHEKLTIVCQIARHHGLEAKLTASENGVVAIALYDLNFSSYFQFKQDLLAQGCKLYELECGGKGLEIEVSPDFERFNKAVGTSI